MYKVAGCLRPAESRYLVQKLEHRFGAFAVRSDVHFLQIYRGSLAQFGQSLLDNLPDLSITGVSEAATVGGVDGGDIG